MSFNQCRWSSFLTNWQLGILLLLLTTVSSGWAQSSTNDQSKSEIHSGPTPEDWNSLSLKDSKLQPQTPIVGEKADLPEFTRELLRVQWRLLDPIDLYVIRPKGVSKPPVILYLYSFPSDTDRFRDDSYCARLTAGGYTAIGFVSALTGPRFAMRPMKQWFVSELQESLGSSVHDVQMILNYLSTRDDLDLNHVGMFGTGSGGTIAILAAAADPRITVVDALNPWGDWPDWVAKSSIISEEDRPIFLKPEFLKKVAPLDPVQWLPQVKAQVRIVRLADDTVTPQTAAEKIDAAAGPAAKIMHYESVRQFYGVSSQGRVFQWVKDQLRPAKPATETVRTSPPGSVTAEPGHNE